MRALADAARIRRFMQALGEVMLDRGLVDRAAMMQYFEAIEPDLYRYPALDPAAFRQSVERVTTGPGSA